MQKSTSGSRNCANTPSRFPGSNAEDWTSRTASRRRDDLIHADVAFHDGRGILAEHSHWLSPAFMDAAGHCPIVFHSWLLVVDGKLVVIDPCTGNDRHYAFHNVIQLINPELDVGGAEDLPATFASRRRLIRKCIDRNALLVPAHFPAPYAGWIHEQSGKTVFVPIDVEI